MTVSSINLISLPEGSKVVITTDVTANITTELLDKHGAPYAEKSTVQVLGTEKKNGNAVDLHNRLVDVLINAFIPQSKEMDMSSSNILRRGVASVVDDIIRLAEDCYGVSS